MVQRETMIAHLAFIVSLARLASCSFDANEAVRVFEEQDESREQYLNGDFDSKGTISMLRDRLYKVWASTQQGRCQSLKYLGECIVYCVKTTISLAYVIGNWLQFYRTNVDFYVDRHEEVDPEVLPLEQGVVGPLNFNDANRFLLGVPQGQVGKAVNGVSESE